MRLPVNPPILPMLSKRTNEIPQGQEWIFEPKWDGFRALVFRDREEILIQSRDGKSLNRYFPELLEPLLTQLSDRCVLDGEIVVAKSGSRSSDIVHMVGNEPDMRAVVVKPGSADTTYIETDNVRVITLIVPGAAIDDVPDDVGLPFLLRDVSDAGIRDS